MEGSVSDRRVFRGGRAHGHSEVQRAIQDARTKRAGAYVAQRAIREARDAAFREGFVWGLFTGLVVGAIAGGLFL